MQKVAKLLLEGKACNNCIFYNLQRGDIEFCASHIICREDPYEGTKAIPEERVCEKYKTVRIINDI